MLYDATPANWQMALWLIVLSPAIGSFLGVLVDRLPRGEDVLRGRSACRNCGTPLGPRDLVPIVSFAATRGRCRHCDAPIPQVLLLIEIAAIGLAVLATLAAADPLRMGLGAAYLWCLLALGLCDLRRYVLPRSLSVVLLILGGALALARPDPDPWGALGAAAAGALAFWVVRTGYRALRGREGLGMGDIWLIAGIGAASGPRLLPVVVLVAALGALAAALAGSFIRGRALQATTRLPFGAFLCATAGLVWLLNP